MMAGIPEKNSCLTLEGKGLTHRKFPDKKKWKVKNKKYTTIFPQQKETSPLLLFMHQNIHDPCIRNTEKENFPQILCS